VSEDKKAQEYALPVSVASWFHISPLPPVLTNAQIKIAIQAIGTMILLAMNSHLNSLGCITRNGRLPNQKMKKLIMVAVSIPWLAGMPLRRVRKEGQMAPIMTRTEFAPFMF
jgi:hypothetical protein